jgi:hypothetical protein
MMKPLVLLFLLMVTGILYISSITETTIATPDPCKDGEFPMTDSDGEIVRNPISGEIECIAGP